MTDQADPPAESGKPTLIKKLGQPEQPLHLWLPVVVLKFLVFLAFAFVLVAATLGLGNHDLNNQRLWAIIAGIAGLLLLLAIDRLIELQVSPSGLKATLSRFQARALDEVRGLEDREAVETARAQILRAKNLAQVEAARAKAVELNVNRVVERVKEAIRQKRKLYVRYRSDPQGPEETYSAIPLDIKPGRTPATKANDYLWVHSDKHNRTISLRLGRVLGVELSEETFDPAGLMKAWPGKAPEWNLPREW